jgi:hypothetical protein
MLEVTLGSSKLPGLLTLPVVFVYDSIAWSKLTYRATGLMIVFGARHSN